VPGREAGNSLFLSGRIGFEGLLGGWRQGKEAQRSAFGFCGDDVLLIAAESGFPSGGPVEK
jgi:hypothetical protein